MEKQLDIWNSLVKVMNTTQDQEQKEMAERLLRQYNTSVGSIRMKDECTNFLTECGEKYCIWI